VGDGVTDDTAAIQRALDAASAGTTLVFPAGRVFAHSGVLKVRVAGVRLTGGGTLLATNELTEALFVDASNTTVDHLTLRTAATTKRWAEYEKQGMRILDNTGANISDVVIDGSGAAGIYIIGSSGFTLARVAVNNTRADAIHITGGSHDGTLTDIQVSGSGDDGVAVVSLVGSPAVSNIVITRAQVSAQKWGRAFSVVGGTNITWRDIYSANSNSAALYIAAESEYNTVAVNTVLVDGATIVGANTNSAIDHGAVMLYNSQTTTNTDITMRNIRIDSTRTTATRQVSLLGGAHQRVQLSNFTITGGPAWVFGTNGSATDYNTTAWTYNGTQIPDHIGW
jgi:hypothetical protein